MSALNINVELVFPNSGVFAEAFDLFLPKVTLIYIYIRCVTPLPTSTRAPIGKFLIVTVMKI